MNLSLIKMENNANEENPFQDLLSAALSESGLTDDFDLSGLAGDDNAYGLAQPDPAPFNNYSPAVTQARAQPTLRAAVQGTLVNAPRVVRPAGTPIHATPIRLNTGRGQPIVLSSAQASQLVNSVGNVPTRPGLPQAASTPTGAKTKKSIIHIVTPKNIAPGTAGQAGATVKRVIQLQSASGGQLPAGSGVVQQAGGGIKVIQLATSKPNAPSPQNTVTLSGGDGKTYKIVTIKSAGSGSQEGSGQRVIVTSNNGEARGNVVHTMLSGATGSMPVRTIVRPADGMGVRTATVQPRAASQTIKVLPSQATSSAGTVTQIAASSSGQPIIIRTPSRNVDGQGPKTVTKVLKIIKPTSQGPADAEQKQPQFISFSNSSTPQSSRMVNLAVVSSQSSSPALTLAGHVVSSQIPANVNIVSQSTSQRNCTSVSVQNKPTSSPMVAKVGQVNSGTLVGVTQAPVDLPPAKLLKRSLETAMPEECNPGHSQVSDVDLNPNSTSSPQIISNPGTSGLSVAEKTTKIQIIDPSPKSVPNPDPSTASSGEHSQPKTDVPVAAEADHQKTNISENQIQSQDQPAATPEQTNTSIPDMLDSAMDVSSVEVATSETMDTKETMAETPSKNDLEEEPQTTDNSGWDMFGGGGGDLDLFSQALQQLSETNKMAKEFEELHKNDFVEEKKTNTNEIPSATTHVNKVTAVTQPIMTTGPSVTNVTSGTTFRPIVTTPNVSRVVSVQNPGAPSGRSSPTVLQLLQPGRGQSPVTIVHRVGSPLTTDRPGSPQVITLPSGGASIIRTLGQPLSQRNSIQTIYTQPGTPVSGQGSTLQRIISMPQNHGGGNVHVTTTPTGHTVRRIIQPSGRVIMPPGTPLSGAPHKVVVGSINQLGNTAKTVAENGTLPTVLTDKVVSQLWANDDIKLKKIASTPSLTSFASPSSPVVRTPMTEEEMEAEDEELGHAETYAEYMPPKLKIGLKHPDPVVETSSLSSVEPPGIWYKLSLPEHIIDLGALSALQLETIVYASQKHETLLPSGERAGFLVGDGAGVGKGRTIAGMIYENYQQGRKRALWLSVSTDLKVDAERDLYDVGASKIEVHPLNKFKYAKISSHVNGSVKKGVIFATYSSLIGESHSGGKYRTRFKQLLHWFGKDFDGIIVFDECHRAKNLCPTGSSKPTKTGVTVLELQRKLPKARIVYASATGASEPRNMAYMTRLGLWGQGTPFREFMDFIQAIEKRGVGAMELVAMDMKLRGMYIARQLSFHGVSFKVEEIPIPKDYVHIYNTSVNLWVEAREKFQKAVDLISAEQRMRKTMWGQFWSAHQRFFKYLCISAKVRHCVRLARDAVKNGKCVVIGLQSTGEARTLEQLEDCGGELIDFVSTAKGVLQSLIEKHFPAPDRKKTMDLFGWSSSIFDNSPQSSPKLNSLSKRRKHQSGKNNKKPKLSWSDEDSLSGSDEEKTDKKKPAKSSSDENSDLSLSESSSNSDGDSEADDFNPFGAGSDSDDDPWLKKVSKKNKEKKKKKAPKEKKKKKKDKENKTKKAKNDSDSDEFDDIDSQLDKVLMAAGLKSTDKETVGSNTARVAPAKDAVEQAIDMKTELLKKVEKFGELLPPNTLDELIDQLGGPENVAEMTGRKGRVVSTDEGFVQYESRSESDTPLELMNLAEKQRFMNGEKNIAIISEAASSGISLQADRRVVNQRRRVHITLELPWSADRAIQQFGRTHRSNQVSAPEYVFLISQLAGERRFASTVAKRLESLGALTHGDRRATESRDLSRFNIDNKFGRAALEVVMKSVLQQEVPLVAPPENYPGVFFADVKQGLVGVGMIAVDERTGYAVLEKEYNNISKFLNRILGMKVDTQNHLFKYFTETLAAIVLQAKRNGRWDMGILDLGTGGECVSTLDTKNFKGNFSGSNTTITLNTISVERGLTWEKALEIWRDHDGEQDGFYLSIQSHSGRRPPVLVIAMIGRKRDRLFRVYRPNTGIQGRMESLEEIKKKYKKVYPNDARVWWEDQYNTSAKMCTHAYWRGSCRRALAGMICETGLRCRTYHVLSGSVLSVWTKVESVLASTPGGIASRMQIMRLRTDNGKRIVGTLIPSQALPHLEQMLSLSAAESPHKQIPYTPFQPKPVLPAYSSLPSFLDSPSSSPRASPTPSVSVTPTTAQPKQYLSMPMFL